MIKLIWVFISLNILAWLIFIGYYLISTTGRHVDTQEKGWTFIMAGIGLLIILLAALPLLLSGSRAASIFSGVFAFLPFTVAAAIFVANKVSSLKNRETFAEYYYSDKTHRSIAAAIEKNDTNLLKQLIPGQDMNIRGKRINDEDGLNYLQFAIHLRSNPLSYPFDDEANTAAIRILLENGTPPTPALAEAARYLPPDKFAILLDAGANPNCSGSISREPLLFQVIGENDKKQNDIAILLIKKGADVNAKNYDNYSPVMYAIYRAGTTETWSDTWRLVRYMLEEAHADYAYISKDGVSVSTLIQKTIAEAADKKITMPQDFTRVVNWLHEHHITL